MNLNEVCLKKFDLVDDVVRIFLMIETEKSTSKFSRFDWKSLEKHESSLVLVEKGCVPQAL